MEARDAAYGASYQKLATLHNLLAQLSRYKQLSRLLIVAVAAK